MFEDGIKWPIRNRVYIEPEIPGLDRRVFRYMNINGIEFAYYDEWINRKERSRWYGYANKQIPENVMEAYS